MLRSMALCLVFGFAMVVLPHVGATRGGPAATPSAECGTPGAGTPAAAQVDGGTGRIEAATTRPSLTPPLASPVLHTIADIPLPGSASRFDYQSLDTTRGVLYVAHMGAGQLIAFDIKTNRVIGSLGDLPGITGVLAVPELGRVYASVTGDHQIAVIDARTLRVMARVGKIGFPDGLDYAPAVGRIFVSDESGRGELVIDARTNRVVTTIDIGGEAGNTHFDPVSGCVVVAVQTRDRLVFIDPATDRVVAPRDLDAGCNGPHGFLIDAPRRRIFVTCEDNARLLVVDLRTMRVTANHPVGDGPDVLAFDPGWHQLYVASETGAVSVFDAHDADVRGIGAITIPNAHSIAVDPTTHRVYLPLADIGGRPVLRIMTGTAPNS